MTDEKKERIIEMKQKLIDAIKKDGGFSFSSIDENLCKGYALHWTGDVNKEWINYIVSILQKDVEDDKKVGRKLKTKLVTRAELMDLD